MRCVNLQGTHERMKSEVKNGDVLFSSGLAVNS